MCVETGLRLLDEPLTPARLRQVLERFHGFWTATEPSLDAWADAEPEAAAALQWPRRRRLPVIAADLRTLGHTGFLDPPAPVFGPGAVDTAQALGWLYVAEGSTLGGAVIERRVAREVYTSPTPLTFFVPYPEGPGPMWLAYLDQLDRWTSENARLADRVEDAAATVFDALAAWLEPVMLEHAA